MVLLISNIARFFLVNYVIVRLIVSSSAAVNCPRLPKAIVNNNNAINCVVNPFVEATPISGPACVNKLRSDSRTNELSGALQIAKVLK